MTTYISILRGINVSGQKLIKMDALKNLYEKLGFENIQTYLQSGNVIFVTKEKDLQKIEILITSQILETFGFNVPVIIFKIKILNNIINNNPFLKDNQKELAFLHVTFLAIPPIDFKKEEIIKKKQGNEEIAFSSNAIYLYCPNGYGQTKLNNNFLEKKLNVIATTRNWKTINNLLNLARK